jgi:DNA polymerase V
METGFPSPAHGYESKPLDLNLMLIHNKAQTYIMEMQGHALESMGIYPKDWLIVDRSRKPTAESVVIALYEGQYVCRVLHKSLDGYKLLGDTCTPIKVDEDVLIIGVVSYSIRRLSL